MAKTKKEAAPTQNRTELIVNNLRKATGLVDNLMMSRQGWFQQQLDTEKRNLNYECGYPDRIPIQTYQAMFDREGPAARVVRLYPEESWAFDPEIEETSQPEKTEFEKAWDLLLLSCNIWSKLQQVDELSGIGNYGVLLIGVLDGRPLDQPAFGLFDKDLLVKYGVDAELPKEDQPEVDDPEQEGEIDRLKKLLYLMPFAQTYVDIDSFVTDKGSPRFGQPLLYSFKLGEVNNSALSSGNASDVSNSLKVHWSRVIHVADNLESSVWAGRPRQQNVFNRLCDLRKLLGGSAEMFWKGAFPGFSFEVNPDIAGEADLDRDAIRVEFEKFTNSLQRFIAVEGVHVNQLSPQVASPRDHLAGQLESIAIALACPLRIFMGSEEAKLASSQDTRVWNRRIDRRRRRYLTPMLIRPFIDRMIAFGILPKVKKYEVKWPDLDALTDMDKAEVAAKLTAAMQGYVTAGCDQLIDPLNFLSKVFGWPVKEVVEILESTLQRSQEAEAPDAMKIAQDEQKQAEQDALDQQHQQAIELEKTKGSVKAMADRKKASSRAVKVAPAKKKPAAKKGKK